MSFQPVLPATGLVGWRLLQRTYTSQFETLQSTPQIARASEYFLENIAQVETAADLVSDRRLLSVALSAFGLEADIDNRFFIQKILEDGSIGRDALANRLSDTRYRDFSEAFGFGPQETRRLANPEFGDMIVAKNARQQFEVSVGQQDDSMRIALFAERALADISGTDAGKNAKWYTILGQPPLRSLFQTVFRLPPSFGQIDIDQQLDVVKSRAQSAFGSDDIGQFSDAGARNDLITKYIARTQIANAVQTTSQSIALVLLQSNARR